MAGAIRKLYRNTLFRLSLLGALLFVLSLFAALGYIYYATIESELRRVDRSIGAEIAELQSIYDTAGEAKLDAARQVGVIGPLEPDKSINAERIYNQGGTEAVGRAIFLRSASYEGLYVLVTPNGPTGNLANQAVQTTGPFAH